MVKKLKNKEERAEALDLALESINEKHGANTVTTLSEIAPQKAKHPGGSDPAGEQNNCAGIVNSNISISEEKNMSRKSLFETLCEVDVSDLLEKRATGTDRKGNPLRYLSWSHAWKEIKRRCPDASYEVKMFGSAENPLPYAGDPDVGYMVYTEVTIENETIQMWLPVLDGANRTLKAKPYQKNNNQVQAINMFDVNKTIMRCLAKNIAMFGLGISVYAGEDLPETSDEKISSNNKVEANQNKVDTKTIEILGKVIIEYVKKTEKTEEEVREGIFKRYKVKSLSELTENQANDAIRRCKNFKKQEVTKEC